MVSHVQNLDETQSYCVTAHYHMQSYYIHPPEITALKEQVQK